MEPKKPSQDEHDGVEWWDGLTETGRRYWLKRAGSAQPLEAWRAYKQAQERSIMTSYPLINTNSFAFACYQNRTVKDMEHQLECPASITDMNNWRLNESEWRQQLTVALHARRSAARRLAERSRDFSEPASS